MTTNNNENHTESDRGRPFTEEERVSIRDLLEESARRKWLKSAISGWGTWVTVIVTSTILGWDTIKRLIKAAIGP